MLATGAADPQRQAVLPQAKIRRVEIDRNELLPCCLGAVRSARQMPLDPRRIGRVELELEF
jgi:hypothetical protein